MQNYFGDAAESLVLPCGAKQTVPSCPELPALPRSKHNDARHFMASWMLFGGVNERVFDKCVTGKDLDGDNSIILVHPKDIIISHIVVNLK